jgi:predicted dehydrogenase
MPLSRRDMFSGLLAPVVFSPGTRYGAWAPAYRACIIGDSQKGLYGHAMHRIFELCPNVKVVGLADPVEEGRRTFGAQAKAERLYADYREMLAKEKPELVVIAPRWTLLHREYFSACAAIGAHGIIEKPLASDLAEADAMADAADAGHLKWGIGFNFRVLPEIQALRRLVIDEGFIGEILEVRGRGKEDHRAGGEDLVVLGTHIFDLMRFFLGDPHWVTAEISSAGKPVTRRDRREASERVGWVAGDRINAMYGFQQGIAGYFSSVKTKDNLGGRWGLDLYGSKGVVSIRQNGGAQISLFRSPTWAPGKAISRWENLPNLPNTTFANPEAERYLPIIRDVLAKIGLPDKPLVSLQDGRASLEMIQGIYAAHLTATRVAFPLADRKHPLAD